MEHPFADLIGLVMESGVDGSSRALLTVDPARHYNPQGVVHGAVIFAMADTGMGAALYPTLDAGHICATIEIKINYFAAARGGELRCETRLLNRGKRVANLQSEIICDGRTIAQANGNFAIFALKD